MLTFTCPTQTWAWIFLISVVMRLGLLVILSRYYHRSRTLRWFVVFSIAATIVDLCSAWFGCTADAATYHLVVDLRNIVAIISVPLLVIFTIHFINKEQWLTRFWFMASLLAPAVLLLVLLHTDLVFTDTLSRSAEVLWGYRVFTTGPLAFINNLYFTLTYPICAILIRRYYLRLADPQKRREARIVQYAIVIPLISGLVVELALPAITGVPAFPILTLMSTISSVMIGYALIRYGIHIFNVGDVSSDIAHAMPGGLIITDHCGSILYANEGASRLLGYRDDQLPGLAIKKLLPNAEAFRQFRHQALEPLETKPEIALTDTTLLRRDKQPIAVNINLRAVRDHHELINIVLAVTDISPLKAAEAALAAEKAGIERTVRQRTKELREAQAQLLASIRSLPFGFAVIDPRDRILTANQTFGQLIGTPIPDDPIATSPILHEVAFNYREAIDLLGNIHKAQTTLKSIEQHIEYGPRFYRFFFMPIIAGSGKAIGTVLIIEDTTEDRAAQRSRDEFFSIASHELRTPLTAIRGNSQMMLDYYQKQLKDPDLKQMVSDIHESSVHLIAIVNDFLDVSRLEQGRIEFNNQSFDITGTVQQVVREFDVTGSRRKLSLTFEPPANSIPPVLADATRVRQILINLISNGLKYTETGGVHIMLTTAGRRLQIAVTDTGQGIPLEAQHLLFHKFQQAAGSILTRDNTRGTGLGLYISRLLAEGMHGRLYLANTAVGQGSTFVLEIPLAPSAK